MNVNFEGDIRSVQCKVEFVYKLRKTTENLDEVGRSQDIPAAL